MIDVRIRAILWARNNVDYRKTYHLCCVIQSSIPEVTKTWRGNIFLMSFCREFAAILSLSIESQEQSKNITDSHTTVCLLSFILPLRKCPILQCQHPRGERLSEVIKDEMEWLGKCQWIAARHSNSLLPAKASQVYLWQRRHASPTEPVQKAAGANTNAYSKKAIT